jgi:DNA-directed RNA polymerase subunit RPC12/RpoP
VEFDEPMSCDRPVGPSDTQTLRFIRCEVCSIRCTARMPTVRMHRAAEGNEQMVNFSLSEDFRCPTCQDSGVVEESGESPFRLLSEEAGKKWRVCECQKRKGPSAQGGERPPNVGVAERRGKAGNKPH